MANMDGLMIGGVYQTDLAEMPIRVIAFDKLQVFYDVWWAASKDWGCRHSLNSKVFFYRTLTQRIISGSELVRREMISDEESAVYRADLPFSICRNSEIYWSEKKYGALELFEKEVLKNCIGISKQEELHASEIILVPFGPKGGHKKSVAIKALNGSCFTGAELLWQAHNIQSVYIDKPPEKGVGLYRLGFEKKLPTFYIGGFYDSAGFLKNIQ